jgi:pimeloyl-ACP methyl ester carboxylesterase
MITWLLLRGLTREAGHWNGFERRLASRLGAGHRAATLDLPGNGDRWRETSPWSVSGMIEACAARPGLPAMQPPQVVVAMSLGAMVALEWVHRSPQQFAGAVLINTSTRRTGMPWQRLRARSVPQLLSLLRPGLPPAEREARVLAMTSSDPARHAGVLGHWAEIARRRPVSAGNTFRQLVAAARYEAPLRRPPVPVLLLASANDRLVSPECSSRFAARWSLPLRMHPTAGHDLPLDDPDWVLDQITAWWKFPQ